MSALSSVSSFTSVPVNVPGCDAWGSFTVGSPGNVTLLDGYGISGVTWAGTGIFGISFSNPERFSNGAYVVLATPEMSIDAGYGPIAVRSPGGFGVGGATATGLSGGIQILSYTYPNGFHPGGGTAELNDPSTGAVRVNLAAFSFATESDLRVPAVANYLKYSEDLNAGSWGIAFGGAGLEGSILSTTEIAPNGTPTAAKVRVNAGDISSSANYSILTNNVTSSLSWATGKPWTCSFWAKGVVGGEKIVVRGAAAVAYTLITLTKEWKRYSVTEIAFNTRPAFSFGTVGTQGSDVSSTFYVWGFQHEPGSIASDYVKTEGTVPVIGNQDARKQLVPGAGGYGADGNTYASTPYKNFDKRRAVAYGTIVIPPNKGNSALVSAYIENGFNIKGVSAGGNSLYDLSFVQPMANDSYCVILSGEYESTDYTPLPEEYTLLLVRAGAGNKYKTPNGFRVEELRQYTVDNSWIEQSVRYQRGFTQRIHFMVFGGGTYGQP